jgi:hypothetical protein
LITFAAPLSEFVGCFAGDPSVGEQSTTDGPLLDRERQALINSGVLDMR